MKASDLFVKCLEAEGVEQIFGVPGEENLDLLESLRNSKIKFVITRHEQAAGFMAATYGRLTGKPGVCLATLGPGATNLVTAAAYAFLGAMPMVMITGQKPIKRSKQGSFQIINTVQMFNPLTKYSKQISAATTIPAIIRESFKLAIEERPGPVHLELPEDIAAEESDAPLLPVTKIRRSVAEEKAITQTVEKILQADMPLLLVGAGANRKLAAKMLTNFVDKTGIYFFNTQMGKGVIDERNPRYLGTAALSNNDYLHCAIEKADLIINVGHDVIEKPPFIMHTNGPEVIHINFNPAKVDSIYFPQLEVVGDIANAIWQVTEKISNNKPREFTYFSRLKQTIEQHISGKELTEATPVIPQRLVSLVRNYINSDGILTLDNGMYKLWFARNYKTYAPNTLLLDNALATMGAGLPSAIATKLVSPEKQVVCVCGDGGFMMNSQELETAVRLGLNLTVIVLVDKGFGMIKWKQQASGFADFAMNFTNPDFVKLAESYNAKGIHCSSSKELSDTLDNIRKLGGVKLISVDIDYSQNYEVFTKELADKTCLI